MSIEIKVPTVGESISEVTLVKWYKKDGDYAERDEVIAELESEKATFELNAEKAGVVKTLVKEGDTVNIGDVVCSIDTDAAKPEVVAEEKVVVAEKKEAPKKETVSKTSEQNQQPEIKATPVAAAIIADKKVDIKGVTASGSNGKIVKQDVMDAINNPGRKPGIVLFERNEREQKMSNLRKTISRRLVEAKNSTAMLTTFNEVDMSAIMEKEKSIRISLKNCMELTLVL